MPISQNNEGHIKMNVMNLIAAGTIRDPERKLHFFQNGMVRTITLRDLNIQAEIVCQRLLDLGLQQGDRVGILGNNSLEWVLLDLAVIKLGGVVAGLAVDRFDPERALTDYGLKCVFVEHYSGVTPGLINMDMVNQWLSAGPIQVSDTARRSAAVEYDSKRIIAIKFTSGSTAKPKGIEATVGSVNDSLNAVQSLFSHNATDNILVFLPQYYLQQRYWLYSALVFGHDITLTNADEVLCAASQMNPTIIMGVPGFYDDVKKLVENDAHYPADYLVSRRQKIALKLGNRIRYLWTGSAPANRATLDFFNDAGVPLYEGYGSTEACIVAKNNPQEFRIGSVGKVLPNKTVRFDEKGVLIVASRHPVNTGYTWCAAGDNEKMFLTTGEVYTQDMGYLDEDGYLYIQGRVDDTVALSIGLNVVVRPIEDYFKEHPAVHECVVFGTGKPTLTAIVSLAVQDVDRSELEACIDARNATVMPEQRVHALIFAPHPFSVENGMLTPQYKPIRTAIFRAHAAALDAVYARGDVHQERAVS